MEKLKNNAGVTLVEILIGIIISTVMMGAMYTSYNAVSGSYSQVSDRRLKCATKNDQTNETNDTKKIEVFTYCSNQVASKTNLSNKARPCMYTNNTRYSSSPNGRKERFYDERYFARMEVGVTTGKMKTDSSGNREPTSKKKYIYFQLD